MSAVFLLIVCLFGKFGVLGLLFLVSGPGGPAVGYRYDELNRLESVDDTSTGLPTRTTAYTYNANGSLATASAPIRIQKTLLSPLSQLLSTTAWLVDTQNHTGYAQVVEERVTTGGATPSSLVRVFTFGHALLSQATQLPSASTFTLSYHGVDGFGTVRQLTDASGTATDAYDYDAFGNLLRRTGTTANAFLYRSEQYDADLGLYYLRARYLNPDSGRFWSMDEYEGAPDDPASLHKYLYANADPVLYSDPSGYVGDVSLPALSATSTTVGTLARIAIPRVIMRSKRVQFELACATIRFVQVGADILGFEVVKIDKQGPQHHIGSNKQTTPGSFTERLEKLFAKGGMKLGDWSNKLNLPKHFGPHKDWYHQEVLDALESAVAAVANPTPGNVAAAIRDTLMAIADKICDKNSKLYKTLTK